MQINWEDAPEWANVVVDAYYNLYYLEHSHRGKITYVQRVDGTGVRMTSADHHIWWSFDVVDVRPATVEEKQRVNEVLEMAGMAAKRKVRKGFDPKQPISVDVSDCTEAERKEVQQAFFDVGIKWFSVRIGHEADEVNFRYLDAVLYTNSTTEGKCKGHLMHGILPRTDSISHKQFLSMVYEAEQQGHNHAHLMAQYAEDAKTTDKPWELWQFKGTDGSWMSPTANLFWVACTEYRRKPKVHIVNGVEIPDLRFTPKRDDSYYCPVPHNPALVAQSTYWHLYAHDKHRSKHGMCYEDSEEGKQAAILHAKAMLGIA